MGARLIAIAWKQKPRAPMMTAERAQVSVENGLVGDWRGAFENRQITIVCADDWLQACAELGEMRDWTIRRANLLIDGLVNPQAPGGVLKIGPVRLLVTGETEPCSRMDAQWPGLRAALTPAWRGGLTTRVLEGGEINLGDEAIWSS
jgi:MOSC domain-containing protein YiiM